MKAITVAAMLIMTFFIMSVANSENQNQDEKWFCESLKYTYQIEVYNSRGKVQVSTDLCELIEKNRKQSETVFIELYNNVRLKILSQDEVDGNAGNAIRQYVYL